MLTTGATLTMKSVRGSRHAIIEGLSPGQYEVGLAAGVINFVLDDDLVYYGGDTSAFVF